MCRTYILPIVKLWIGCDILMLASASRNFSCRAALLDALLALASWYHVRSSSTIVEFPANFFDAVSSCCTLASDVFVAFSEDAAMISAAGTLLSIFSRDRRTVHCVVRRCETRRLIIDRLQAHVSDTACACVLMSVLRDCSALASASDADNVLRDILCSPCIHIMITAAHQFNMIVVDTRAGGSQELRAKADLLLNAASGLALNISSRAFGRGANDLILASGLIRALSDSAAFALSSLSTTCNCMSIMGRLMQSQCLRDELCYDAQHASKMIKFLIAAFHAHSAPAPRLLTLTALDTLLGAESCSAVFFRSGGSASTFDTIKSLSAMHKSSRTHSEAATIDAAFTFATSAATASFVYDSAQWQADLHTSGHLRAQALLIQTINLATLEAAAAAAALMLLVVPHPSPSFVRPPSCSHAFGNGPVLATDNAAWISPVAGVHMLAMREQVDVDRAMQAMRAVMAFCETDDLTSENSRINVHKIAAALRALTSKISTGGIGGGGGVADPNTFKFISNVFAAVSGLIGHVTYKLSVVAGSAFRAKQRSFQQAEEFNGIMDEYALISKRPDEVEAAVAERMLLFRSKRKECEYPAHKAMLVISSEESTGINPDEILRQYGTSGSVALVHSGHSGDLSITSTFLGFSDVETKPIPFLPPMPSFGEVPPNGGVESSLGFYRRHKVISSKGTAVKSSGLDSDLASLTNKHEDKKSAGEFEDVESAARDMVRGMELHTLDSAVIFVMRGAAGLGAKAVRPVLNLAQSMLQLESEWDMQSFSSPSNAFLGNAELRDIAAKILQKHADDVSVARPCLVLLCFSMQHLDRSNPAAEGRCVCLRVEACVF